MVGAGLRTSYTSLDNAAPNGTSNFNDFEIDSVWIFTSGKITKHIGATVNAERTANESFRVLDAYGQLEFSESFNI